MAIQSSPSLPQPPALDDLELAFRGLQGIRDDLAGFLADPFYEPLRAGIDGQLARLYRAITDHDRPHYRAVRADQIRRRVLLCAREDDAPAGAGDLVEAYRG